MKSTQNNTNLRNYIIALKQTLKDKFDIINKRFVNKDKFEQIFLCK